MTRCSKCFDNHFPSLPKFCRWTEEHADRNKKKNKKDNSTSPRKINLVSKYIEIIKTRIHLIQEKCISSHGNNNPKDQRIKKKQDKMKKIVITTAESCAQMMSKYQTSDDPMPMIEHCSKKISKIMKIPRLPDASTLKSIQSVVVTFDKFFYNNLNKEEDIYQCDGNDDFIDEYEKVLYLFGVTCEIDKLTLWINFLQGFTNIWYGICNHELCSFYPKKESCSFCLMRSLYARLNNRGKKGPRSLKPFEAVYHLGQMEKDGLNWRSDDLSLEVLLQETLKQVSRQSNGIKNIWVRQILFVMVVVQ